MKKVKMRKILLMKKLKLKKKKIKEIIIVLLLNVIIKIKKKINKDQSKENKNEKINKLWIKTQTKAKSYGKFALIQKNMNQIYYGVDDADYKFNEEDKKIYFVCL